MYSDIRFDEKPIDIPIYEDVLAGRQPGRIADGVDLVDIYKELSKIRLEIVKSAKQLKAGQSRESEYVTPPADTGKIQQYLEVLIRDMRSLRPEIVDLRDDLEFDVKEKLVSKLFPTIDAFDRFFNQLKNVQIDNKLIAWLEGIRAIYNGLLMVLREFNVKEIPVEGVFNPKFHTVLGYEIDDEKPQGTIIAVEKRGFMMGTRLLRTPEVMITKRSTE
jgi:molecular chaperone GrpE (heat shock protein)